MTSRYAEFLAAKRATAAPTGRDVDATHPALHPWQSEIVAWACKQGRAAIFSDTGTGKTRMQLAWAEHMRGSQGVALIVAPLAVTQQTIREAAKLGLTVRYARSAAEVSSRGLWITNYERVADFDPDLISAVVLDESSILKQSDGKTRTRIIRQFEAVPYRLACSATPAPNDPEELTNQAEFLGIATRTNMLAAYFVHDSDGWRLKGHAKSPMFEWMASWAVAIRRPSDMGYSDDGYVLPGLQIIGHNVDVPIDQEGQLFPTDLGGVGGRAAVRRATLQARCEQAARIVAAEPDEPWLIWCGLNDEAETLAKLIPESVNVPGNWSAEDKAAALLGFADGQVTRLITKPSIAAQGMNWQHCARMIFVGMSDSYEAYYQAIRRCHRYGQTRVVDVHIVLSELEGQIAANVRRKESEAAMLAEQMVAAMRAGKKASA